MFKIQSVEDQQKVIAPINEITETLWYNCRTLIDTHLYGADSECRAWLVSKINRIAPYGICNVTLAQDRYDQDHDFIEKDEDGNVIGMWADYYQSAVAPQDAIADNTALFAAITSKITYSGTSSQIKVGGSKTFTLTFYDDDIPIEHDAGEWSFTMDGIDIADKLTLSYPAATKVKVRIPSDDSLIGKILSITNTYDDIVSSIDVEVIAL